MRISTAFLLVARIGLIISSAVPPSSPSSSSSSNVSLLPSQPLPLLRRDPIPGCPFDYFSFELIPEDVLYYYFLQFCRQLLVGELESNPTYEEMYDAFIHCIERWVRKLSYFSALPWMILEFPLPFHSTSFFFLNVLWFHPLSINDGVMQTRREGRRQADIVGKITIMVFPLSPSQKSLTLRTSTCSETTCTLISKT